MLPLKSLRDCIYIVQQSANFGDHVYRSSVFLDTVWATKLYFAYLEYPAIEVYALSKDSKSNRQLLLAFGWILATQDILGIIVRINVTGSVLGRECSRSNDSEKPDIEYNVPETPTAQMNSILHLGGKVNCNIKEISELISERAKLVSKVHAASINVSGLSHLSVSELALVKRLATVNKNSPSEEDRRYLKELSTIGSLLDIHTKWLKKQYIFFDWMVTVVDEHNKSLSSSLNDIDCSELSKFISLLHHIVQEKLQALSSEEASEDPRGSKSQCVSRLLRSPSNNREMQSWLTEISAELDEETKGLSRKKEKLSKELKEILRLIPSCIQL